MAERLRPGLLLDRDGVINLDHGYIGSWDRFDLVPGIEQVIAAANQAGWGVAVVTNQSGIARGFFTEDDLATLHQRLQAHLAGDGDGDGDGGTGRAPAAWIDAFYHCPYLPGAPVAAYDRVSEDRKPRPGMLLQAMADLALDPARCVMIGDKPSDMEAAAAAGIAGHLFEGGNVWEFVCDRLPHLTRA